MRAQLNPYRVDQPQLVVLDRVLGNRHDLAGNRPVVGIRKGIQFDFSVLSRADKADIAVENLRFNFQSGVVRHNHQQGLRRGDDAANRVHGQFLHGAAHRGGQMGLRLTLSGLGFVALVLGQLLLRLIEGVELFAAKLRDGTSLAPNHNKAAVVSLLIRDAT